jgi:hypothetical protein
MKKLVIMLMVAATLAFGQADNAKGGKKQTSLAKVLNRAEIDELLSKPDQVLIIDVRRPDEVKDIGGFPVYLSIQINDLEKSLAYIPKDRTIIALSNHAAWGGRAADILGPHYYGYPGGGIYFGYGSPYPYYYNQGCGYYDQWGYWHPDPGCYNYPY